MDALKTYHSLVLRWTKSIQLISKRDEGILWERHILDSCQSFQFAQSASNCADIGSGGGFPGVVWAILAKYEDKPLPLTLIERDVRKAAFLRKCKEVLSLNCEIMCKDFMKVTGQGYGAVSARAVASIASILNTTENLRTDQTVYILPKGKNFAQEVEDARENWLFKVSEVQSGVDTDSRILLLRDVRRVSAN